MSSPRPPRRRTPRATNPEPEIRKAARGAVDRGERRGRPTRHGEASAPDRPTKPAKSTTTKRSATSAKTNARPPRRDRSPKAPPDVKAELVAAVGAAQADKLVAVLVKAAGAVERGRDKEAVRALRPLRDQAPGAPTIRELLGVALYRLGRYDDARRELDTYAQLTGLVDQHPVLMDCLRALKRYRRIPVLWEELRDVSPSGELVAEGRIVMAGAMADRGDLQGAIRLLEKGPLEPKRAKPYHLRLWYALADLYERSGNVPRARTLFERIKREDAQFVDVLDRVASLG